MMKHLILGAGLACTAANAFAAAEFDCVIEPRQIVELRPAIEGVIDRIEVDRGDLITRGQVLVVLQSGVEQANAELSRYRAAMTGAVRSQEARAEFASLRDNRRQNLASQSYISAQDRDDAAAEHRMAEADLLEARDNKRGAELDYQRVVEQLKLRTLRSPFAGVVMERLMNPGDVTDMSDSRRPVLRLAEIGVLNVEVVLPSEAFALVRPGATVEVVPDIARPGPLTARVKAVDRVMDAASGTFGVRLELANDRYELPAGIRCRARFNALPASLSRVRGGALRTSTGAQPMRATP
jgi:RND family efflux transporter MFP subunit